MRDNRSYREKLTDPRWQIKRLKVFERDKCTCRDCGAKDKTLHVHHLKYRRNPWDSPMKDLLLICWECHEKRHPEKHHPKPTPTAGTPVSIEHGKKFFKDLLDSIKE